MADNWRELINFVAEALVNAGSRFVTQVTNQGWMEAANAHLHISYAAPSISPIDVLREINFAASRLKNMDSSLYDSDMEAFLLALGDRANSLQFTNITSDVEAAFSATLELANAVSRHVPWPTIQPPSPKPEVDWEDLKDRKDLLPRDLTRRLRSISDQLEELEPRTAELAKIITEIEQARAAAEQLPTDMADLSARRTDMRRMSEDATKVAAAIATIGEQVANAKKAVDENASASEKRLSDTEGKATNALDRAERALSGATSVGLAKAFTERRKSLSSATGWWTAGLALSLIVGGLIGWERFTSLREVLVDGKSASVIWANVLLTIVGIGGPVWFAWLSTKQIGTTFRLSEDYAFKASVSQAYEGYRSEAVQIDDALRSRLFEAALDRIEEAPIRLVDTSLHSSPLQELLSSPAIRKQLEGIPNISGEIMALIKSKAGATTAIITPVAGAAAAAKALADNEEK